jgi:hypothetical protein
MAENTADSFKSPFHVCFSSIFYNTLFLLKEGKVIIINALATVLKTLVFIEKALDLLRHTPTLANKQPEHLYSMAELTGLAQEAGFSVKKAFTMNGIAPWLSFLGKGITNALHRWESRQHWLPGSIMVMELSPKANR